MIDEEKGTPVPGASGTITVAGEEAEFNGGLSGLKPEETYYLRVKATNSKGTIAPVVSFVTPAHPVAEVDASSPPDNITAGSAHLRGTVLAHEQETHWRFEYATAGEAEAGHWTVGPSGTVPAVVGDNSFHRVEGDLAGLSPDTIYYVRLFAENSYGVSTSTEYVGFQTAGPGAVATFATRAIDGESEHPLGSVTPGGRNEEQTVSVEGAPTGGSFTLTLASQTTAALPFHASPAQVQGALEALSGVGAGNVEVGAAGGRAGPLSYTVIFTGAKAGVAEPQMTANASGLTPAGAVTIATTQSGVGGPTRYHFEYVTKQAFEETGFTGASSTPEVSLVGSRPVTQNVEVAGHTVALSLPSAVVVGEDLPVLKSGESYVYRLVAVNEEGAAPGAAQTLMVPVPAESSSSEACPNEAFRTGASAHLPDCRAYEQVTPVEKEGAREITTYGFDFPPSFTVGEDGERLLFGSVTTKWGGPASYESYYLFSRGLETGWLTSSTSPQPEAGVNVYTVRLQNADLTSVALEVGWGWASEHESAGVTLATGPVGGPYTTVVSMPRSQTVNHGTSARRTWVAGSADFSKLVFETEDRKLLSSHSTGTVSGADLYEYAEGQARQLNVDSAGATIGTCGARMVDGDEEAGATGNVSSPNAVSADGSRVFFEAVPGSVCSEPEHLYMRRDGTETIDLGEYRFVGGNADDSRLLLERSNSGTDEFSLYDIQSQTAKRLFTTHQSLTEPVLAHDFTSLYFSSTEQLTPEAPPGSDHLYRYDILGERLHLALPSGMGTLPGQNALEAASPDGRYYYWNAQGVIPGVAGGTVDVTQVYRYDSVEGVVQCMSCASSFDPEPRLESFFFAGFETGQVPGDRVPEPTFASADGNYVFFETAAALVAQDIDGESGPECGGGSICEDSSDSFSRSSDVYEWRKDGVDGCAHVQGCLALISSGTGGLKVMLLGTDPSGKDAFFTTDAQLVPRDKDTAFDIYDARIGGGVPEPARPVECEGDACSTPFAAPSAITPSSATFQGAGDLAGEIPSPPVPKAKPKPVKKAKKKAKSKKHGKRSSKRAGKSDRRRDK